MKNPIFNRQHIKEYFGYGALAGVLYAIPVLFFLSKGAYEDLYYIYIGLGLFMFTIFFYALQLVNRPYDRKRAVSMLIAGNFTTLAGVLITVIIIGIGFLFYFPDIFVSQPVNQTISNAPATIQPSRPSGLLFMIMMITIFGNISVGSFVSVVTAYVGKKDQTSDEPAHLETHLPF